MGPFRPGSALAAADRAVWGSICRIDAWCALELGLTPRAYVAVR